MKMKTYLDHDQIVARNAQLKNELQAMDNEDAISVAQGVFLDQQICREEQNQLKLMETNRILAKMLRNVEERATKEVETSDKEIECL